MGGIFLPAFFHLSSLKLLNNYFSFVLQTDRGSPLICNSRLVGLVTSSQETYLTNVTKYYDFIFPTVPNSTTEQPPNKTNTSVSDSVFNNNFVRIIVIVAVAFVIAIGSFALIVKFCFLISKK